MALGGSAATLFSQVSLFSSTPRLSQLRPLACLGVYARPLRHCAIAVFLSPSPRSPASFPLDPGNPNKSVSKFKVLFRVFCPTRCAVPSSQSPFPQACK